MNKVSYYPTSNEIVYHGFYQIGLAEGNTNKHFRGLSDEQIAELEVEIASHLSSEINYIVNSMNYGDYSYMDLIVKYTMLSKTRYLTPDSTPNLLIVFTSNQEPDDEFMRTLGDTLEQHFIYHATQGNGFSLADLDYSIFIG